MNELKKEFKKGLRGVKKDYASLPGKFSEMGFNRQNINKVGHKVGLGAKLVTSQKHKVKKLKRSPPTFGGSMFSRYY